MDPQMLPFRLFLMLLTFFAGVCFLRAFQLLIGAYRRRQQFQKVTPEDREELVKFSEYLKELDNNGSIENQDRAYEKVYGEKL